MMRHKILAIPLLAAGLAAPGYSGAEGADGGSKAESARDGTTRAAESGYRALRASQMIGMSVRGTQGDNVGQIEDLVLDMGSGQVRYAALRFDPGFLRGEKLVPVPTSRLRMAPDRNDLVYDVTREQLERAAVDRADWGETWLADRNRLGLIDETWNPGRPQAPAQGQVRLASRILDKQVNDRAGQPVGEVDELVVNMAAGRIHYAVVTLDRNWAGMEKRVVLPVQALAPVQTGGALVLHANKARLQQMRALGEGDLANLDDPAFRRNVDQWLAAASAGVDTRASGAPGSR